MQCFLVTKNVCTWSSLAVFCTCPIQMLLSFYDSTGNGYFNLAWLLTHPCIDVVMSVNVFRPGVTKFICHVNNQIIRLRLNQSNRRWEYLHGSKLSTKIFYEGSTIENCTDSWFDPSTVPQWTRQCFSTVSDSTYI